MKLKSAFLLALLGCLAGPALADTASSATSTETCPLAGPLAGATEDCKALRLSFQTEISACMRRLHADAEARAGQPTTVSSHTYRARYVKCDSDTRTVLGLTSN